MTSIKNGITCYGRKMGITYKSGSSTLLLLKEKKNTISVEKYSFNMNIYIWENCSFCVLYFECHPSCILSFSIELCDLFFFFPSCSTVSLTLNKWLSLVIFLFLKSHLKPTSHGWCILVQTLPPVFIVFKNSKISRVIIFFKVYHLKLGGLIPKIYIYFKNLHNEES